MRRSAIIGLCCLLPLLFSGAAAADVSKDERNLEREVKRLNDTAAKPDGEKAVMKRLTVEYKTSEAQIQALRDRKLGFGEVAAVLSLAQSLPGGASDANVQRVLALRQGPPVLGWGKVAQQLGTKLGATVSQVRKTANNANREIKNDHARQGRAVKPAPAEQKAEPQAGGAKTYHGEGRMLRHGSSAQ